ncbi:MAG: hypothetical protein Q7R41_13560 [Phycisphaerales bacterium]|nr:hypothetical protein [Phycisphaerales bacterium]
MSAGEVVGLVLTAALVGGACGALLAARWHATVRHAAFEERRIDATVRWLDMHAELSRTTIALVKAVRTLATEPRNSAIFAERRDAVRKAQRRRRKARGAHSLAEAAMILWSRDPVRAEAVIGAFPDDEEIRRIALHGTQEEMNALFHRISEADRRAVEGVRRDRLASARTPRFLRSLACWAEGMVSRVVRSWDRPS